MHDHLRSKANPDAVQAKMHWGRVIVYVQARSDAADQA